MDLTPQTWIQLATVVVGALLGLLIRALTKKIDKVDARIELLFTTMTTVQVAQAKTEATMDTALAAMKAQITAFDQRLTNLEREDRASSFR